MGLSPPQTTPGLTSKKAEVTKFDLRAVAPCRCPCPAHIAVTGVPIMACCYSVRYGEQTTVFPSGVNDQVLHLPTCDGENPVSSPTSSIVFSEAWKESEFGGVLSLAVTLERGAGIRRKLGGRDHI